MLNFEMLLTNLTSNNVRLILFCTFFSMSINAFSISSTRSILPKKLILPLLFWAAHNSAFSVFSGKQNRISFPIFGTRKRSADLISTFEKKSASPYDLVPKGCSLLTIDPPTLDFVEEELPQIVQNRNTHGMGCKQIFECKVSSSPPDVNVLWYRNNEIIKATALRDSTLNNNAHLLDEFNSDFGKTATIQPLSPMIGFSQMTHRICLDSYLSSSKIQIFRCVVQSVCQPELIIQSPLILARPFEEFQGVFKNNSDKNNKKRNISFYNSTSEDNKIQEGVHQYKLPIQKGLAEKTAPLITMITSTRMELAGREVEVACHASGMPSPRITWNIIDDDDESVQYPIDNFPFIHVLANNNLIVQTSKTDMASVTLKCEARNMFGSDYDTSTIILLEE